MHGGRSDFDDRQGDNSVVLTTGEKVSNIGNRSSSAQPEASLASKLLTPLRKGKPVIIVVDDPRLPKRKRIEKPLLFLTPLTAYGPISTKLMVSLQTYGCEVVDTLEKIKPATFYRMGLSMKLSSVIADELNLVFSKGEPQHASTKT